MNIDTNVGTQATLTGSPKIDSDKAAEIIKSLDASKVISESQDKIKNAQMESMSNDRASREPLPSVASDIFNVEPLTVKTSLGDVTIRPMVSFDINIFKTINSPFYEIIMQSDAKEAVN